MLRCLIGLGLSDVSFEGLKIGIEGCLGHLGLVGGFMGHLAMMSSHSPIHILRLFS